MARARESTSVNPELRLPATFLSRYLFFLGRRPVSAANAHYLHSRIDALKSLVATFEETALQSVADALRALTPANLIRVAPRLQGELSPYLQWRTPRDLVGSSHAPPPSFWNGVRRLAVVYGPAIGIGDEIVTAPLPAALRRLTSDAQITVMTAYRDLWEELAPAEDAIVYRDVRTLIDALRGDAYDAVAFVDFEPPGLLSIVARDASLPRFLELSLGTRTLSLLDNETRRLYQMPSPAPYAENFYDAMRGMLQWLGAGEVARPPRTTSHDAAQDEHEAQLRIVVSPFTSKEEPSEVLWRSVLTSMIPPELATRTSIVLDSGPNAGTRAFAIALRDPLRASGLTCELAANGRAASLGEMLAQVRAADVVIAADSYLAHAAPAFGVPAFVVARDGLDAWRVPSPGNFYFRSHDDAARTGAAMQALLRERFGVAPRMSPLSQTDSRTLRDAASALEEALLNASTDSLFDAWQRCFDAHNAVLASLPEWPRDYAAIASDQRYGRLMPRAPHRADIDDAELRAHLAARFAECANSNLWKLVRGHS
jgi:ADP-heptose:LPS heptosyltransferase